MLSTIITNQTLAENLKSITKNIVSLINLRLADVVAIYIFGSRVSGLSTDSSDYDIAILGKEKYSTIDLFAVKNTIETQCKIEVDLIDLKAVSTVTSFEMLRTGERLFTSDERQADQFEYLTISYYQKLQEERREILEDIKCRGSVYG